MADHVHKLFISLCLLVIYKQICVDSLRYGLKANTLHIPVQKLEDQFGERTRIIEADLTKLLTKKESPSWNHRLFRRSTAKHTIAANYSTVTQLNDSHTQMIVHWAGLGSDVIIALSRDPRSNAHSSSNLFVSDDYGKSFRNVTGHLVIPTGEKVIIDHYFNSKTLNSHYIFTDIINNYTFTTTDYGKTFRTLSVPFRPKTIQIHPSNPNVVLGMDEEEPRKRLYVSTDFGYNWRMMQEGVKAFHWGNKDYDKSNDIFVERVQIDGGSSIVKSSDFFVRDAQPLMMDVEDFQMIGQYMFAVKKVRLLGGTSTTLQLWVSYKRGKFVNAQFGNRYTRLDYFVADATEDQVFLCVQHNKTSTNLYISDVTGSEYSLSLENIIYYNPKGANKDSWLRYFAKDPFVDLTKISALRGVYIANIQTNTSVLTIEGQKSLITFDKGGTWVPLTAPLVDSQGHPTNCSKRHKNKKMYKVMFQNCSLHLTQEFSRLYPGSRASNIMSKSSAPGLVIGMGVTGTNLKHDPDMFLSSNAGYTWRQVLEGNQYYAMGDHGGLIISVPQFRTTDELFYSWNEGETWVTYKFHEEKIRVYGILTEPGEMTSIFTLFGSHLERHRWLIIQIDLRTIFPFQCKEDDYKMWSFPDQKPYFGCILGKKTVFERRIAHADCYNGRDYDREVVEKNCSCSREDYECDVGFALTESSWGITETCEEDRNSTIDLHHPPVPCPEGTFYPYSRGYRKISGDTCHGGQEYKYSPYMLSCPVAESKEFLLYSSRHFIRRYIFGQERDENIMDVNRIGLRGSIYAIAFNYRENIVYWSEGQPNKIMQMNLNGTGNMSVVAMGRGMSTVESLVFDWTGGNLYWIDSVNKSIEVARKNGQFRRKLVNHTHLDRPRGLVLDPHFGWMYWTDWSRENPRIMKASMDGNITTIKAIVTGTSNVYWPNGITIDHREMKIYWTDAHLDRISSANVDGSEIKWLVHGTSLAPHPYAIAIYKDKIYWSDWLKQAIYSANKLTGHGIMAVKTNITDVMDLKILDYLSQHDSTACSKSNGGCSQLCLPKPGLKNPNSNNRTCKCDELMPKLIISDGGMDEKCACPPGELLENNTCVHSDKNNCTAGRFQCKNGDCIPSTWFCDRDNDCSDGSDEMDCPYASCTSGNFQCSTGHCIPLRWHCDFDNDCGDLSDEVGCVYRNCTPDEFHCDNGRCINMNWTCDFDDDCRDGSDEKNCKITDPCTDDEFHCSAHQPKCIPWAQRCDGHNDCTDRSDETNCTTTTCTPYQFRCNDGQCIYLTWRCDGGSDCHDGEDEVNCTATTVPPTTSTTTRRPGSRCHFWQFECNNRNCVWWSNRCDHVNDCGDHSDELNCGFNTTTASPTCASYQFRCNSGQCIQKHQECNGYEDCWDSSDEINCRTCSESQFQCKDSSCIEARDLCDDYPDCEGGEDELNCTGHATCSSLQFRCLNGECIDNKLLCNGENDCIDHSDEQVLDCSSDLGNKTTDCDPVKYYQCKYSSGCVHWMNVCDGSSTCLYHDDEYNCGNGSIAPQVRLILAGGKNLTISWAAVVTIPGSTYIVSYMDPSDSTSTNVTKCSMKNGCTITGLKPLTRYFVTVFVVHDKTIQRPHRISKFSTTEAVPDPPSNVKAIIDNKDTTDINSPISVQWTAPSNSGGTIVTYMIYCQDKKTKATSYKSIVGRMTKGLILPLNVVYGHTYHIWVTASTVAGESVPSQIVDVTYHSDRIRNYVTNFVAKFTNISCVSLTWSLLPMENKVKNYIVKYVDSWGQDQIITKGDKEKSCQVCDLCPSETYFFSISASNNLGEGPSTSAAYVPSKRTFSYLPTWNESIFQSLDNGVYQIKWNPPYHPNKGTKLTYTLFYDYNPQDMDGNNYATKALNKTVTGQTFTVVQNLRACESYSFLVAVSKPGRCPPSRQLKAMQTGEDDTAQPENIEPVFDKKKPTSLQISWNAGCYDPGAPLGYIVNLTEVRTGKSSIKQTLPTKDSTVYYNFTAGLKRGATYTLSIKNDLSKARWSEPLSITVLPYGAPEEFKEILEDDDKIKLFWNPPSQAVGHIQKYELYWKRLGSVKDDNNFVKLEDISKDQTWYNADTVQGIEYSFKIRIIDDNGYPGEFAEEPFLDANIPEAHSQTDIKISRTRMIAIIVSVTGVVITLVLVLGFFIIRHRRLQRSFLAFANSHYDTRSGTTTFESNELGEDEDSPMIQGFSDDEPLVIA